MIFFKRFINWLNKWWQSLVTEEKIAAILGGATGIFIFIFCFLNTDIAPATEHDYLPLEKQVIEIQQNNDMLFSKDCDITIKDEIISVTFENEECSLIAEYDQNFTLLSVEKKDKYMHWCKATPLILLASVVTYCYSFLLLCFIIAVIKLMRNMIKPLIVKIKNKRN